MKKTFDQSKDEIAKLCHYFDVNRKSFFASGVKEAHVRQSLIDPFFENLGWDVRNINKIAPQYREVIPEDSLDIEGHQKAPDYTFRVGTLPKFYAEAKKCGVNINVDLGPAYQLRRYAFSAKLALSILTDFEELGIYECSSRPKPSDKASHSRVLYFRYDEYPDHWRDIWDIFSREAVWSGSFDQYISSKRKRGTSEVDVEFLKDIEHWREELARNLALRNGNLTVDELNSSVQLIIDRIVFLRMAEDRGLESYEQLLKLCEQPDIYRNFITKLCRKADEKYNSGLFHFHKEAGIVDAPDTITPGLAIDDKIIKPIIQNLYFEFGSPYHFGVLPVEILGTVYERFLGKVIRLTAGHQAKVEEKPEVRKAGGVYYTPSYIVKYIVKNTIGKQVEGKSPAQITKGKDGQPLRILDMACGSGSFLLGAYQYLLDHCMKWYENNQPVKHNKAVFQDGKGIWRLTISERKRILTTHIFGVDIDRQAVEVTKLSLLIKALEGENDASLSQQMQIFQERALPNLSNNIKCGNSLISPDYFAGKLFPDAEELNRINPFDWETEFSEAMQTGGFDCVIGNPPYIRMETFKGIKAYLKTNYACHAERSDLYAYIIEKAHKIIKPGGQFGMIVSNKFLRADYGQPLRKFIKENANIHRIVDFAGLPVFRGATVRTIIFLSSREKQNETLLYTPPLPISVFTFIETGLCTIEAACTETTYAVSRTALTKDVWSFAKQETNVLLNRLMEKTTSLAKYCQGLICRGVVSGLTEAFVIDAKARTKILKVNPKASEIIKPFLNGRDIRRYVLEPKEIYLIYTYHGVEITRYPAIVEHLELFKESLKKRATKQEWYELQQPQYAYVKHFEGPKIVFPDIAIAPRFILDENGFYGSNTIYFIPGRDLFLLGLLNSKVANFYFRYVCAGLEGKHETYLRFFGQYLEGFPIPISINQVCQDKLVMLVEQIIGQHKQKASTTDAVGQERLQRLIDSTDKQIDALVYELYGLTQEEIEIVEAANK